MVGEAVKTGRVSLAGCYLKRRLLSSAVPVIVVALLVAWGFVPLLFSLSIRVDGIFSALYMVNYRLVAEGINYQNTWAAPAAFHHFWSLGAEQRFYSFWPLLIIAEMVVTRRWRDLLQVLFTVVIVVSVYISQYLLTTGVPMSYFAVQSRAWEFGVGAIVALATGPLDRTQLCIRASFSPALPASSASASRIPRRQSSPGCTRSFPLPAPLSPVTGRGRSFVKARSQEDRVLCSPVGGHQVPSPLYGGPGDTH